MKTVFRFNPSKAKFPLFEFDYELNMPFVGHLNYEPSKDILVGGSAMLEHTFLVDVRGLYYPILFPSTVTWDDLRSFLKCPKALRLFKRVKAGYAAISKESGMLDADATDAIDELQTYALEKFDRGIEVGFEEAHLYRR